MHPPVVRAAAAATLVALSACADRPTPLDPLHHPTPAQHAIQGSTDPTARHQRLARRIAVALRDAGFRHDVLEALRQSQEREGKVYLQRFLRGSARARLASLADETEAAVADDLDGSAPIEIYFPIPAHRAAWRGDLNLLVATAASDRDAPVAFDPRGLRRVLDAARPPDTPTLALGPAEQRFRDDGVAFNTCFTACDGEAEGGGSPPAITNPGLYMTYARFNELFEGWLKGEPEFEVHILGQDGASTKMVSYQCSGEQALHPYQYDQNELVWNGQVMLFSQAQLDNYKIQHPNQSVRVFVVEDDDDTCVLKTDTTRVNNLFKDLERIYGTFTGGKDNKVLSLKTFTRAISLINLIKSTWSFITTQDDVVGTAIEDVVAREFHPGANWIVKGVGSVTTGALRLEMK